MDLTNTDPEIERLIAEALPELREIRREAAQSDALSESSRAPIVDPGAVSWPPEALPRHC